MTFIYAMFFGAGTAALSYNTFVKRVGYTNSKNVFSILAAVFVIATIVFYTILAFVLHV